MVIHIIIPAYNEAGRIETTLDAIYQYHREGPFTLAVSVVDDGSADPTVPIVTAYRDNIWPSVRILRLPRNLGKGAAVRYGMLHLDPEADWALLSDADLSTPIEEVEKLLAYRDKAGIIIGSRALDPSLIKIPQPYHRQTMGKVFNLIVRTLLLKGFFDTQCGFKLFKPFLAREIFMDVKTDGFAYDVEVVALALQKGYRVKEVPVRWDHVDMSRVSLTAAPLKMFLEVLRLRVKLGRAHPAYPDVPGAGRPYTG